MCEKDRNSAQCAWLFSHAHLIRKTSIKFKNGIHIYFSALSFVLAGTGAAFFASPELFRVVFAAGLDFVVFLGDLLSALFVFANSLRCCWARSSRNNSSWLGLSTSMQGSAWGQTIARPLMPMR